MNIRIYYKSHNGEIVGVVLEDSQEWNCFELRNNNNDGAEHFTFPLTEENMALYVDNPHEVNLEAIQEKEINENLG